MTSYCPIVSLDNLRFQKLIVCYYFAVVILQFCVHSYLALEMPVSILR